MKFLQLVSLATLASAAHNQPGKAVHRRAVRAERALSKRESYSGVASFYYDDGSIGACNMGKEDESANTVALNVPMYGDTGKISSHCGKKIKITCADSSCGSNSAIATIVDACPGCAYGSLDMTPGLFTQFASKDVGLFKMTWYFVDDGGDDGGNDTPSPSPTPTTTKKADPPTTTRTPDPPKTTTTPKPTPKTTSTRAPVITPVTVEIDEKPKTTSKKETPTTTSVEKKTTSTEEKATTTSTVAPASSSLVPIPMANISIVANSTIPANISSVLTNATAEANATVSIGTNTTASNTASTASLSISAALSTNPTASVAATTSNVGSSGNLERYAQIVLNFAGLAVKAAEQQ